MTRVLSNREEQLMKSMSLINSKYLKRGLEEGKEELRNIAELQMRGTCDSVSSRDLSAGRAAGVDKEHNSRASYAL